MIALGIETSATTGSVALLAVEDLEIRPRFDGAPETSRAHGRGWRWRERGFGEALVHGRDLLPSIQALLEEEGLDRHALDAIYVSIGPGSYTGLRVGVTAAKVLGSLGDVRLIGVESLEVLARGAPPHEGPVLPVLDARLRQLYWALYRRRGTGTVRLHGPDVCALDAFPDPPPDALLLGSGVSKLAPRPEAAARALAPSDRFEPRARHVLEAGLEAHRAGARHDPLRLAPLYLRPSEPEMKREASR